MPNALYYGDNLDILRQHIDDASVDLVYLDPPFKSDANYNLLFRADGLNPDEAQLTAFKDTWTWDDAANHALAEIQNTRNILLINLINALNEAFRGSPVMAYLVNMAIRLFEIRSVLKPTGSIYLHCDPTASHYLKMIMDAVFEPQNFRSEIIWRRTGSHNKAKRWAPLHDVILFYTKSNRYTWNNPRRPYMLGHVRDHFVPDGHGGYRTNYYGNVLTGSGTRRGESGQPWRGFDPTARNRHWAIPGKIWEEVGVDPVGLTQHEKLDLLHERGFIKIVPGQAWPIYERAILPTDGPAAPDIWAFQPYTEGTVYGTNDGIDADVRWLTPQDSERLGYPTQKPTALLERIISASSNDGDLILDPFCGCGTTIAAAEALRRRWIGIDISPYAIQLIRRRRLDGAFPYLQPGVDYIIDGLPTTLDGARLMAGQDTKAFEVWAVALLDGIPNEKKGADRGIDGRIPFRPEGRVAKFAVVSVKSGALRLDDVRALIAVARREEASSLGFGVLVTLREPTPAMRAEAAAAGAVEMHGNVYTLVQILTVEEIFAGQRPRLPLAVEPAVYRRVGADPRRQARFL